MIRLSELEVMVCDLFVDAYRAGTFGLDADFAAARCGRASLIEKLGEVYAELEFETRKREALEVELKHAIELMHANRQLAEEKEMSDRKEALEKLLGPSPDDIAPDDMEPELRDCIPFPDVEDLEGSSGLLGGDD